jgi:hypothetical protein
MFREDLRAINRVLVANGLPAHTEPESLPEIKDRVPVSSIPYRWLHVLRRAVAYALRPGERFRPLRPGEPELDRVHDDVLFSCESHLICHSDGGGFYVPVDFPEPLYDELGEDEPDALVGGILGSSQGGLRELALTAPLLGIRLVKGRLGNAAARAICQEPPEASRPGAIERHAWLYLHERLRQSVELRAVALFG